MLTVQECSESKSRILIVETNVKEESKIIFLQNFDNDKYRYF